MKPRKAKLEVWLDLNTKGDMLYFWHLKSPWNGKIICAGEPNGYLSKGNALKGWKSVVKAIGDGVNVVET